MLMCWEGHISVDVFGGAYKCLWGGGGGHISVAVLGEGGAHTC